MTTADAIRDSLCATFCKDVAVQQRAAGIAVSLPIVGRDGDHLTAYVNEATGGWRVSDMGATLMRLSYENDLAKLLTGARDRLYKTVLKESGLDEDDGEIYIEVPAAELTRGLFALGQGVTRIEDLGLWTRGRVENTFQDDLRGVVIEAAGADSVIENYEVPGLPSAENYPVDFYVKTPREPLYVFGVQNRDKARLATIILQHLASQRARFNSMIVYADIDEIAGPDQKRLMLAANDSVPSIEERDTIIAKIGHRMAV
ncbi:DUF1828 domain-containing protein [Variovorax paradoxus]|uniref:DUF1828 domain-containing protein n=1 Tax=Variovorax paradoxus TaxID=34073 RepID=A0A679J2Y4_VARPD|nr:hypothetical protein VVAX_04369 [Variovorax paradoxus]